MASEFCYVATGWPGLGLGPWGPGEGGPHGGTKVARAEMDLARGPTAAPGRSGVEDGTGSFLEKPMAELASVHGEQSSLSPNPNSCHPTEILTPWTDLTRILMVRHEPASPIPGFFLSRVPGVGYGRQ